MLLLETSFSVTEMTSCVRISPFGHVKVNFFHLQKEAQLGLAHLKCFISHFECCVGVFLIISPFKT